VAADQPPAALAGGLRLAGSHPAPGERRVILSDEAGRVVRGWRVTSRTQLGAEGATPALVGGDPVVVFDVSKETGGRLYQLRTSRTRGVDIARYSLTPDRQAPPTTPTTAPAPEPPAPKGPPVDNGGGVTAPTVSLPPAQPAGPPVEPAAGDAAARWWLPGLAGVSAGTLAGLGMWLLYRRRRPAAG
jgi:hypothetical protein